MIKLLKMKKMRVAIPFKVHWFLEDPPIASSHAGY